MKKHKEVNVSIGYKINNDYLISQSHNFISIFSNTVLPNKHRYLYFHFYYHTAFSANLHNQTRNSLKDF